GPAVGKIMFPPLDRWATNFLRNPGVRRKISENAYFDRSFVTPDAELCASLHLLMPCWQEALIAFTKSGGYNFLRDKIPQISLPTLVLWGRQDKILGVKDGPKFDRLVPDSQLIWIEDCGHVPHLEQAKITAEQIIHFLA
ncbi:MAG: alpha/beta hydrolase, partial [Cyanobacteria bacterium J06643_4]